MHRIVYLTQLEVDPRDPRRIGTFVVVGYRSIFRERQALKYYIPREVLRVSRLLCVLSCDVADTHYGVLRCRDNELVSNDHGVKEENFLAWLDAKRPTTQMPKQYPLRDL